MIRERLARQGLGPWCLTLVAVVAACSPSEPTSPIEQPDAPLRVINASNAPVRILVDGHEALGHLDKWSFSSVAGVAAGTRQVQVVPLEGTGSAVSLSVALDAEGALIVARPMASGLSAEVVSDTGAIPAPGTSKLRVIHLAASVSAVDVWRRQPDYPAMVRLMAPFPYGAASPFIQSTPGTWTVAVTTLAISADSTQPPPTPAVLAQEQFEIGADVAVTVVILDGPNGLRVVRME